MSGYPDSRFKSTSTTTFTKSYEPSSIIRQQTTTTTTQIIRTVQTNSLQPTRSTFTSTSSAAGAVPKKSLYEMDRAVKQPYESVYNRQSRIFPSTSSQSQHNNLLYTFNDPKPNQSKYIQVSPIKNIQPNRTILSKPIMVKETPKSPEKSKTVTDAKRVYKVEPVKTTWIFGTRIPIPIKSREKGYAFVLNHETFTIDPKLKRTGTEHDVNRLSQTLSQFNLKMVIFNDLKLKEINELVTKLKKQDFKKDVCTVFIVLTHGNENNMLVAADGRYNLYNTIVHPVVKSNKSLLKKPKIFIIQACKGDKEFERMETDAACIKPASNGPQAVPIADLFVCFATYEGHYSYRNTHTGTPFIQELCKTLDQSRGSLVNSTKMKSVSDVMIEVTNAVLSKKDITQVPSTISTLTAPFSFGSLL